MDHRFVSIIEKFGCVDYILHKPINRVHQCEIETDKALVQRFLNE